MVRPKESQGDEDDTGAKGSYLFSSELSLLLSRIDAKDTSSYISPVSLSTSASTANMILCRLLICGMTDWERYVKTSVNMLKPGGYLEVQEIESRWYMEGEEVGRDWKWLKAYYAALQAKGLDTDCARKLEGWMRDVGMETVEVKRFSWPFTKEQKDTYQRILPRILVGQGHSEEEIEAMVGEVARTGDVEGQYRKFRVTLGQKGR